jgi:nucleotide-binding universal stress UspA family protein
VTARTVVVCPDPSATGRRALRWAAAEARRRGAALHVVLAEPANGADPRPRTRSARHGSFADALAAVREAVPGLPVLARASRGPVPDVLQELSAEAGALVVPATLPHAAAVVAGSYCPVVVVPDEEPSPEAERGPVVLAVAPWTGEDVVDLAFEEASAQHVALLAVRAWTEPGIDLGLLRTDRIAEWDRAEERARRELEFALSPWRVIHPDVTVRAVVVQDEAAELVVALSHTARLLVLGRSARGALISGFSESPVAALLRAARCPVLVVPPEGPPRTTWLPAPERGWAYTAR